MGTIEDIAVGVYHHVFQINLDRDLTLDIVLMGHGADVESILVVTFLMELQGALGQGFDHIDLFEIFFNDDMTSVTLRDIAFKVADLAA